jgi:hypothetical protein
MLSRQGRLVWASQIPAAVMGKAYAGTATPRHFLRDRPSVLHTWGSWGALITCISGDNAGGWKRKCPEGKGQGRDEVVKHKKVLATYQYSGKLSRSSSHQRCSSNSFSRSRGFLPSFGTLWGVVLLVMAAGRDECFLYEGSVAVTALRTSVNEVLLETWPDLRRW